MTQFFKHLNEIIGTSDTTMTFRKSGEQITVSVAVKNNTTDKALDMIKPIIISGTADELDEGFFAEITRPVQKASGLISNTKDFEENLSKTEKESKVAKAAKEKADKEAEVKKKAEQKEKERNEKKFKALIEKAESFEKAKQSSQAYSAYKQALTFTDKPEEIQKKMNALVNAQASIFDQNQITSDNTNHLEDVVIEEEVETLEETIEEVEEGENI